MSQALTNGWFSVVDLGGGLFRISEPHVNRFFRANIFFLRGRNAGLVIDFGMGLRPLLPVVSDLAGDVPLIAVATHSHADHIGGFHEFTDRRAYVSEAQACASMHDDVTYANMFRGLDEPVSSLPEPGWAKEDYQIAPAPLSTALQEGDVIDLGNRHLHVLHLPGHSPGGIGLLDRQSGLFFAGDAIYRGQLVDDLPHSDKAVYRDTMSKIAKLDITIAHCGHGPALSQQEMRDIALDYVAKT